MNEQGQVINICMPSDLRRLRVDKTAHYRLIRDIDMEGILVNPVGNAGSPFTGILDGNGFTIKNFVMTYSSSDGNMGIISRNQGVIRNLRLENVTIIADEKTVDLGAFAAINEGEISGCRVSGTLTGSGGGIAGVNSGQIRDCCVMLDIRGGGGLVGKLTGGTVTGCQMDGTVADGNALVQEQTGGELLACLVNCPGTAIGSRTGGQASWSYRDFSHSDDDLTPGQYALRKQAVEHMYRMATVSWTPDAELNWKTVYGHQSVTQRYEAGKTYRGMPYTNKYGSLERFEACFNPDGTLKDFIKESPNGYDGFDLYMGNDCSGSVYWAWCRVGCSFSFGFTGTAMPWARCGTLPVGDYEFSPDMETDQIRDLNGQQKMAESWAKMYFGDAILQRTTAKGGHIRLVSQTPVVYRRQDGTIDLDNSYLLAHEQGGNLGGCRNLGGWDTTWLVNHRYSFRELYNTHYIPITIRELQEGVSPEPELRLEGGVVRSNYRIISTTMKLVSPAGEPLWSHSAFTAVHPYDPQTQDTLARSTVRQVDLSVHLEHCPRIPDSKRVLEVLLGNGDTYQLEL